MSVGVRVREWLRILTAWLTAQSLVQLLGIAAGLLFIHFLPVREFALYTLATSVITYFTFASDLGSTTSLVHFFHRTAKEGGPFAPYLAAVLSLRRVAFLAGTAVIAVAFPRAARSEGYGTVEIALATVAIALCVWFQIGASLRVLALRLADRYGQSYRAELAGGGLRLLLALGMVTASLTWGWLGVFASAAATATTALVARPGASAAPQETGLRPYRRKVLRYLLPTLPSALYFSVQGPLVVWLSATFGGTRNIAEVGALTRLGLLVGLFSSLSSVVFLPRLARITDDRLYRARYLQFGSLLLAIALGLVLAAGLFPSVFLAILGPRYSGLHRELVLVVAGAGLTLLGGYAVAVNLARSWTRWETAAVAVLACSQVVLAALLPLGTTAGVLVFNLSSGAVGLALQLAVTAAGFQRPERVRWE